MLRALIVVIAMSSAVAATAAEPVVDTDNAAPADDGTGSDDEAPAQGTMESEAEGDRAADVDSAGPGATDGSEEGAPALADDDDPGSDAPAKEPVVEHKHGLPAPAMAAAQVGAGWAFAAVVTVLAFVLNAVPVVGQVLTIAGVLCGGIGALSGVLVTVLGDLFGPNRGALLWPTLCGAGGQVCFTVPGISTLMGFLIVILAALTSWGSDEPTSQMTILEVGGAMIDAVGGPTVVITGGVVMIFAGLAFAPVAATAAYWLTSEEKQPGDEGQLMIPGLIAPSHPDVHEVELDLAPRSSAVAMVY